ncbi:3-hydroxyisobutyrate dehydrogenase [Streptomyces sp. Ncost-T6T-1]|uniref:NAD(P)-dependent oxidoreductase n=1 Tax=Streptomyces sp. Ncost-T6T-1 TaxID=1100828 RepID=UPI000805E6AE|nr:NAD(P)-binding domain-containing protein [Streptomyces sp. Ncost-T6T-1]SBU94943.1 3-hydroxyisobutyrate dehydrogenase [Streptomyces sp. Ncost-T6T-1]
MSGQHQPNTATTATATATAPTTTVSVIGLGQMGTRLAQAFLAAGHATTVWNRTPAKADALAAQGAVRASAVEAAVTASPLVVVCLPDYATVRGLVEPVAGALRGRVLVSLTSGTPEEAAETARWAGEHGIGYLDGAAMSGTRLVGRPDALFVFGGRSEVFAAHREVLAALGNAVHVGDDPAHAPVYDTALFGLAWGALAGFYHSLALAGAAGVDPRTYAEVATGHMGFVTALMADHARQIEEGRYPSDDGTVEVHRAAMDHLVHTSRAAGIGTEVPELFRTLLTGAEGAGHGADGIASVVEAMRAAGAVAYGADSGATNVTEQRDV